MGLRLEEGPVGEHPSNGDTEHVAHDIHGRFITRDDALDKPHNINSELQVF